ncbi:DUF4257 domain-containing protein [Halobacillus litoralis]|uniref:DUF4257 domain-containing protein n=1 Tax=Halobacillus litoralis TaxID=45668 RepID=A0A845DLX2_9BACI|nr:DUF4257 domain-containing protein [Halobacillus litoralis]MCA1022462.1 DUF4257 domain-containing protein [Halobacillus litoralis]MYL18490.1 DUF4257 domain-containing protein [Halobacillus litoralis]MYL30502.1 DUF4257 domain-containing protein [Halobacillus halophilus]MYL38870.1 DUF4257 domain-containing protein [Halobacillus litoralis]
MNTLLIAGCIGGITGVVAHLMRNGKVLVFPRRRRRPKGIYLGFLADFLIGAAAAVFAVTYLIPEPDMLRTLIGISILAGMTAENVLLKRELNVEKAKVEGLDRISQRLK